MEVKSITNINNHNPELDRYLGLLMGHHLGDALGAPFEFNSPGQYNGKLEYEIKIRTRWQGTKVYPVGSVTDDSSMSEVILESISRNKSYIREDLITGYLKWANTWKLGIGTNTRALFGGIKTHKTYHKRWNIRFEEDSGYQYQSNGSLMRCQPLAIMENLDSFIIDCRLTNPGPVNVDASRVYGIIIWMAIRGYNRETIAETLPQYCLTKEVKEVMKQAKNGQYRHTTNNRGWVLHAMYYVFKVIYGPYRTYKQVVDSLACVKGDDTDTNAAIAGAIAGALDGYNTMLKDETTKNNIEIMMKVNNLNTIELARSIFDIISN